jgi:hypothetical protein
MCDNWDAFVINDYEAVMPLPWRRKAAIKYLYIPPFIQQLGVTGNHETISFAVVIQEIRKRFIYGDISFSYSHFFSGIPITKKINYVLDLNKSYKDLFSGFSNDLKKNLKAINYGELFFTNDYSYKMAIALFKEHYQNRMLHVSEKAYKKFSQLCDIFYNQGMLLTRTVKNKNADILAASLLLKDQKRIYNLMNTTTAAGRKSKANHALLNKTLEEFSGKNIVFDFEGSDLPGVKEFYKNFGPINQPYFHYHFNYLPFPLNLIKK